MSRPPMTTCWGQVASLGSPHQPPAAEGEPATQAAPHCLRVRVRRKRAMTSLPKWLW